MSRNNPGNKYLAHSVVAYDGQVPPDSHLNGLQIEWNLSETLTNR